MATPYSSSYNLAGTSAHRASTPSPPSSPHYPSASYSPAPRVPSQLGLGVAHTWDASSAWDGTESSGASMHEAERIILGHNDQAVYHSHHPDERPPYTPAGPVTILTSDYDEVDALLHSIYEKTQQDAWFAPAPGALADASLGGVALRVSASVSAPAGTSSTLSQSASAFNASGASTPSGGSVRSGSGAQFRIFPYNAPHLVPFEAAVRALNPAGAVLVRSAAVTAAVGKVPPTDHSLSVDPDTRIQVLNRLGELAGAEKDQCGAFIRTPPSLVLWAPHVEALVPLATEFEEKLFRYIWRTRASALPSKRGSATAAHAKREGGAAPGVLASILGQSAVTVLGGDVSEADRETQGGAGTETAPGSTVMLADKEARDLAPEAASAPAPKPKTLLGWSWRLQPRTAATAAAEKMGEVAEEGGHKKEKRKLVLLGPLYAGCGAGLAAYFCLSGVSVLLEEFALDGDATRFALVVTLPVIFCISVFFCLQLVGNISLILGPVAQYHENSAFYSAVRPAPNPAVDNALPHITIQCPVYKESLRETIAPSVLSVKKAMQTYARQGGTSAIFMCEDGMQLISEEDRQERMAFYANHNIGWVARPGHNKDGFVRKGKFKKASNMNYGLALSLKLEKHLAALEAAGVTEDDGECLEDKAMHLAVEEMYEESGRRHRPWACNGKSLRMGEIVLIIDSDTIVPEDCFRDAAREMYESPDVAIIQHESDVMQVAHHYFENGITHFTRRINKCISYGCANGEVAPFVGHNAFLRWSAVQDAAFFDPDDGKRKQWSESNVSEDFDLALRLLLGGYTLRWATYSEGGFKEGVSLTVQDELARWQKYAYGCDEIIFNPLIRWWRSGPISAQLRGFVWSIAPVHYKIGMMSYMFSYYGIAAATVGSIMNYLLLGIGPDIDRFYLHSFEILLACTVVFPGLGNLGFTLLEYRIGHRNFFSALIENLRWIPFFLFFFGGLAIHLSTAILAHLFSYDMTWGSTVKEVERSTFWIEVPRIWKNFKLAFIICFAGIIMMIVFASDAVPFEWQIQANYALTVPLCLVVGCHILLPIVLNPWLMIFSY
ncbi:glycosyl transferase family group 2-domain-containing protein [Mycena belliarum]|uniref:Glycosyl transferase family group 2-domain-containing protein n=1 Tax=Mycena belliarum TaxID=1033014 RepID=A0AAD6U0Q6_9AGAR|nr:glycosyl transferase family group 2-domain-containing protein [Mycena belliae]